MGSNQVSIYFSFTALVLLILSGITALFLRDAAIDIALHDTYLVISNFDILILLSVIFGIWAITYYITSKILRISLSKILSQIHLWSTFFGILILAISMQSERMSTSPRRYYGFDTFDSYRKVDFINITITLVAILLLASQLIYFVNVIYGLIKKPNS